MRELNDALATGKPLTAEQRGALDGLLDEVETLLDESAEAEPDPDSLAERIREAGVNFEESHPNLTAAVGAVADALARLGI